MVLLGAEISGALVTHGTAVNLETKGEWRPGCGEKMWLAGAKL